MEKADEGAEEDNDGTVDALVAEMSASFSKQKQKKKKKQAGTFELESELMVRIFVIVIHFEIKCVCNSSEQTFSVSLPSVSIFTKPNYQTKRRLHTLHIWKNWNVFVCNALLKQTRKHEI